MAGTRQRNARPLLQGTYTAVRFPQKGTCFDYYPSFKAAKFAPW